ncbi:hypothetical protein M0813_23016 [Anaeramoeba flamelloides]|uniref:Myb-like DNA-binding domain protein n=1 Tax=Anaeramoeba flamelloides TaxID=1746091 RepID=A0ABQ8YBE1_9EUKA|nr:hypothetical protein M0813_23016 [Anaeramoeba flamelloides]
MTKKMSKNKKQKTNKLYEELSQQQLEEINEWDESMDRKMVELIEEHSEKCWDQIASHFDKHDEISCLLRYRHIFQIRSKKGTWSNVEDQILTKIVTKVGKENIVWTKIAKLVPGRNSKQCRERWRNQLDPTIDRSPITGEEEEFLISKIAEIGNKWCKLATFFKGRPDNMLKNHWYSVLSLRLQREKETQEKEQEQKQELEQEQEQEQEQEKEGDNAHEQKQEQEQEKDQKNKDTEATKDLVNNKTHETELCLKSKIKSENENKNKNNNINQNKNKRKESLKDSQLKKSSFQFLSKIKLPEKAGKEKISLPYFPPFSIRKRNRRKQAKFIQKLQISRATTRSQSKKQRRLLKKQNELESLPNCEKSLYFTEDFQLSDPLICQKRQITTDPRQSLDMSSSATFFDAKEYETSFLTDFEQNNEIFDILSLGANKKTHDSQLLINNNQIESFYLNNESQPLFEDSDQYISHHLHEGLPRKSQQEQEQGQGQAQGKGQGKGQGQGQGQLAVEEVDEEEEEIELQKPLELDLCSQNNIELTPAFFPESYKITNSDSFNDFHFNNWNTLIEPPKIFQK